MLRIALVICLAAGSAWTAGCATGNEAPPGPTFGRPDAAEEADAATPPEDASQEGDTSVAPDAVGENVSWGDADAANDVPNPCEGKTCDTPPDPLCQDANNLTVYDANGTCNNGVCKYASHLEACPFGCNIDTCEGDPCIGVTCNAPPANACSDTTHLTVYDTSHEAFCNFGCQNDICNGDPCTGMTCNSPPANFCSDSANLQAYDLPGTCTNGACAYTNHEEFCLYGCVLGACEGDPCQGVTCSTPPAKYCAGPNTLRTFAGPGTCTAGSCSYASSDSTCPFGCLNGVCKDCAVQSDCATGSWCNSGTCTMCNTDLHCGSACTDCTTLNPVQTCNGAGTTCIQCTTNSQCGSGKWCNNSVCELCNTAQHCGAGCATCSGSTPDCDGTSCTCQSGSCGTPCPVGLSIATWQSGADGWTWDSLWRRNTAGYMEAGSTATTFNKNYTQVLSYGTDVDLSNCTSATLAYLVQLRDDTFFTPNADKSERLHVSCSIDGGLSWTDLTPISWPPNQSACSTTYCNGYPTSRAFGWTGQTATVTAPCLGKANVKFGFRATGASAWRLLDPGWLVDQVTVN
jgi:hypothetical protein